MALRKIRAFPILNRSLTALRLGSPEEQPQHASDIILQTVTLNDGIDIDTIVKSQVLTDSTSATIFTTANDVKKRFFIDSVSVSASRDENAAARKIAVNATIGGVATIIASVDLSQPALTAFQSNGAMSVSLNRRSIPVDVNTNITLTSDSATTSVKATGIIVGHYEYFN